MVAEQVTLPDKHWRTSRQWRPCALDGDAYWQKNIRNRVNNRLTQDMDLLVFPMCSAQPTPRSSPTTCCAGNPPAAGPGRGARRSARRFEGEENGEAEKGLRHQAIERPRVAAVRRTREALAPRWHGVTRRAAPCLSRTANGLKLAMLTPSAQACSPRAGRVLQGYPESCRSTDRSSDGRCSR